LLTSCKGRFLGQGGDAIVHETTINYCRLAWKRSWRKRKPEDANIKTEIEILKKLSHQHLVKLVGAYTHKQCLGLLLYPVATCDLQTFFEDAEAHWKDGDNQNYRAARLEQLGYWSKPPYKHKAWPIYTRIGCLISALSYLHSQSIQIRHKDLKPSNILLTRDGLYLSDFGHATDFSLLSRSATEGGGGTFRYYSPEVSNRTWTNQRLSNHDNRLLLSSPLVGRQTSFPWAACS
jgi:serine/threonine protein kinase